MQEHKTTAQRGAPWTARWVAFVQRRSAAVLLFCALLGIGVGVYVAGHLSVDTNTENMLSPQLPWRQAERALLDRFPQLERSLAVVIDAPTPEAADLAQQQLVRQLRQRPDLYRSVFAAETEAYFRQNGLLYLPTDALDALAQQLNLAQPFLATLGRDPSLRGLSGLLIPALQRPEALPFDLSPAFNALADGVGAAIDGRNQALSWQSMMGGADAGSASSMLQPGRRRFIALDPVLDFRQLTPAAAAIGYVRQQITALRASDPQMDEVRVRLTGSVALEHEELLSAFGGTGVALIGATLLVAVLLWLALRSVWLVIAAVLTLVYGLLLTAGFAALAVGHLNLISIAFGLLYVGLGIDYALYLCMQYREHRAQGIERAAALPRAAGEVGGFMLVCALTTSIGFFAFIPTRFAGIGELGLIAGVGMFVSFAVSLTLLPALIARLPQGIKARVTKPGSGFAARVLAWPYRYAGPIRIAAVVLGLAAIALATQARFDTDPLNLRDPHSESVATFRDLLRDPSLPPLTLSVLAPDAEQAKAISARLSKLPEVARAFSLGDLVPSDQPDKLAIIDDLVLSLNLPPPAPAAAVTPEQEAAAAQALAEALAASPLPAAAKLSTQLRRLVQSADGADAAAIVSHLHTNLFGALPAQLAQLRESLKAGAVTEADLPAELRRRYRSDDGQYRVEIWPRESLESPAAMARFVDAVRGAAPAAVGPPIGFLEAGRTVVDAFREAFSYAIVAVLLLLMILLRSVADTLRVVLPLLLAGAFTVAAMVLLKQPFNFANVIALPLVLGVGVDYGVYLAQSGRAAPRGANLLQTSTARAVWYGALITIANFGNLMLAPHPGMASMGLLLTLGLCMTLLCTLVLLPGLLNRP
ncbi:MMPL family transporter [Hydrocarboniphaga sp.]|uniref:MMPL family transporter n=1 Tax=Hydrocarboniphaga sp. TaxID=2033016 RepID=UPI002630EB2C|nr:MMPL family transporter [Hydrocarboniphaga sp.]